MKRTMKLDILKFTGPIDEDVLAASIEEKAVQLYFAECPLSKGKIYETLMSLRPSGDWLNGFTIKAFIYHIVKQQIFIELNFLNFANKEPIYYMWDSSAIEFRRGSKFDLMRAMKSDDHINLAQVLNIDSKHRYKP